jgi:hypothetical protein
MADWKIVQVEDGSIVFRDGQWYSRASDIDDAVNILKDLHVTGDIELIDVDGHRSVRRA